MKTAETNAARVLPAVWFGFFGAFLIGASTKFLWLHSSERWVGAGMVLYGALFLAYYGVGSRPALLKLYTLLMTFGAVALTSRLAWVAVRRPSAYRHWDDWLLLGYMLLGMWSLVVVLWRPVRPTAN